jgi:hypothetical protein
LYWKAYKGYPAPPFLYSDLLIEHILFFENQKLEASPLPTDLLKSSGPIHSPNTLEFSFPNVPLIPLIFPKTHIIVHFSCYIFTINGMTKTNHDIILSI